LAAYLSLNEKRKLLSTLMRSQMVKKGVRLFCWAAVIGKRSAKKNSLAGRAFIVMQ
jgi:hypothetical protein